MNRRDLITLIGGAAVLPVAARAQQSMPVVALLTNASFEGLADGLRAFNQGLRETGFVEGRNLAIEFHEVKGDEDRLSAMAAELVQGIATQAAKAATSTVPIVFLTGGDPVESEFVASPNRPGGNLTGITALGDLLGPKRLQLLHEMAPTVPSGCGGFRGAFSTAPKCRGYVTQSGPSGAGRLRNSVRSR